MPAERTAVFCFALLGCLVVLPQVPPIAPPQQPAFRVTTELVVVDVTVLGRDGRPVKGLSAEDFIVKVDGQPRRVASAQFIDQTPLPAPAPTGAAARVSTNASAAGGRLVLLVVDEDNIRFGGLRATAESIDRLLERLGSSDKVGLATLPGPRIVVDFTADRQRVASAIRNVPGGAAPARSVTGVYVGVTEAFAIVRSDSMTFAEVFERECSNIPPANTRALEICRQNIQMEAANVVADARTRTAAFVAGLGSLLQGISAIEAPKLLVVFSEGVISPEAPVEFGPIGTLAAKARAAIYAIRLDRTLFDLPGQDPKRFPLEDRAAGIASLDALVGRARGTVFEAFGSGEVPFDRLSREVSGYYLIGIEPEGGDRNGQPHHIGVSVRPPGLSVRARPQFVFTRTASDDRSLAAAAMRSPLPVSGLPLRVTTFNLADDDPEMVRVLIVAEIDRWHEGGGAVDVAFALLDDQGNTHNLSAERVDLERARFSDVLSFVVATRVRPGRYTLRLAAARDGRAGSVEHEVDAHLVPAATLRLSDLVVCDPPEERQPVSPSIDGRVYGDRVWSFVQLVTEQDMPGDVELVLDLVKGETGPAIVSSTLIVTQAADGVRTAQGSFDARLLPPGEYGARLSVLRSGRAEARLYTPFTLERSAGTARPGETDRLVPERPFDVAPFRLADVLERSVLEPFLDEVAFRAPAAAREALEMAKAGQFDAALSALASAKPTELAVLFVRGLALLSKGQLQAASEAFRDAVRVAPDLMVGAFYLGACYAAGGREPQAINAWQTSLAGLAQFPAVYRFLAEARIRAGQSDRAVEVLSEALSRWPDDMRLGARMAKALFELKRYMEAVEYAGRVIEREPANTSALQLALRAAFEAASAGQVLPFDTLVPKLRRYRDLYIEAQGPDPNLVAEWVAYVEARTRRKQAGRDE